MDGPCKICGSNDGSYYDAYEAYLCGKHASEADAAWEREHPYSRARTLDPLLGREYKPDNLEKREPDSWFGAKGAPMMCGNCEHLSTSHGKSTGCRVCGCTDYNDGEFVSYTTRCRACGHSMQFHSLWGACELCECRSGMLPRA